ncbi:MULTISPECIES: archaeosortase A [Halorussus]|uniref:archaeosortase A n=1 Tax=Halorussus TaxID=1070314 RepID=UPI00209EC17C|nr:archaeosortase A [Halorussus vallis]USZ75892.1 archaeosortase A [Halorussus vallis]
MTSALTDGLAWLTVGVFAGSLVLDWYDRDLARYLAAGAWGVFGVFWLALFPHFAFEQKSLIEGVLSLAAFPASLYAAYLLVQGRETLFVLSRAVALMGLIYLPFTMIPTAKELLIETVAAQGHLVFQMTGQDIALVEREGGILGTYSYMHPQKGEFTTNVLLACTGLGSMAIFGGLIGAVRAPLGRKLRALAVAIPIIWVLNLGRVVFITMAFSYQWFQVFVDPISGLVGYQNPNMVSYFISDRVLAQSLSVVALVGIAWAVARVLPELLTVAEDVMFIATGDEYDLHGAVGTDRPIRADGEGETR